MKDELTAAAARREKYKMKMGLKGLKPLKDEEKVALIRSAAKNGSIRRGKGHEVWKVAELWPNMVDFRKALTLYCENRDMFFLGDVYRDGLDQRCGSTKNYGVV